MFPENHRLPPRLTRYLQWKWASPPREEKLTIALALPPRERAIFLLHVAAEVEHALMVQYLYAAYSLGSGQFKGVSPDERKKIVSWRTVVVEIARQEMGHLATVQNVLTLINGPITLDRQDYPTQHGNESKDDRTSIYPFPFELEPLTRKSLGKYVLVEMPSEKNIRVLEKAGKLKAGEMDAIKQLVFGRKTRRNPLRVHRVGVIYEMIRELFRVKAGNDYIQPVDISASAQQFQIRPSAWGSEYPDLIIATPSDRDEAIEALRGIDAQGEGFLVEEFDASHFGRFLEIYREFSRLEKNGRLKKNGSFRNVMHNPSTSPYASRTRRITNPEALAWGHLLNTRYRMLLMLLSHSFHIESPPGGPVSAPRGLLISWAFGEMYNLRSIAEILFDLPQHGGKSGRFAGPPFEMPYSLLLPPRELGRWLLHRDLLYASRGYIEQLIGWKTGQNPYLRKLLQIDQKTLDQISSIVNGLR